MDVTLLLSTYGKYFPEERFADVKTILENMSEDKQAALAMAGFKGPHYKSHHLTFRWCFWC